jgi:hypothetical protein
LDIYPEGHFLDMNYWLSYDYSLLFHSLHRIIRELMFMKQKSFCFKEGRKKKRKKCAVKQYNPAKNHISQNILAMKSN